jgi:plasmid stabilization system protein ParE
VRFRREAEHDLREIIAWCESVAPDSLPAIAADIWRAIDLVREFPAIGAPVREKPLRRIVSRRYRFKIAYSFADGFITVNGIFRFQNREV